MIRLFFGIVSSANTPHPCTRDLRRSIFRGSGSGATLYRRRPPDPLLFVFAAFVAVLTALLIFWAARALTWVVASRAHTRYQERICRYRPGGRQSDDAGPSRSPC